MYPKVTEENFLELLGSYAEWKYGQQIEESYRVCPYDLDFENEDLVYKQILTWFILERNNSSGKTVLDEFVDQFVDDKRLASKILQMKSLVYDTFFIIKKDAAHRILARSETDGKTYTVEILGEPEKYIEGRYFTGRIHPWHEDGTYRTTGINKIMFSDEEIFERYGIITPKITGMLYDRMMQEFQDKIESITISPRSKVGPLLKKYPIEWVDGICGLLKIDKKNLKKKDKVERIACVLTSRNSLECIVSGLSEDEKIALRFVLKKGGTVRYSDLCSRIGRDDTGMSWDKEPMSTVGKLRRYGLLVVGKTKSGSRTYKSAVIPADVASLLRLCL